MIDGESSIKLRASPRDLWKNQDHNDCRSGTQIHTRNANACRICYLPRASFQMLHCILGLWGLAQCSSSMST